MRKEVRNIAASIRARLINIASERKRDYNAILRLYFQERFLYRLSVSNYKSGFILKGALLLMMNDISKFRPTKDIDFLSMRAFNATDECIDVVNEIASVDCNDGVEFIVDKIKAERIQQKENSVGFRIHLPCKMDTIKSYLSIDFGFGDEIVDGPYEMDFPILLDFPAPRIMVYSMESAVAEKFEAIVSLNFTTSRMKDFYDLMFIAKSNTFKANTLRNAILVTFENRGTNIEDRHIIYNIFFKEDKQKQIQWSSFLNLNKLIFENNFALVVERIAEFIEPIFVNDTNLRWDSKLWKWI